MPMNVQRFEPYTWSLCMHNLVALRLLCTGLHRLLAGVGVYTGLAQLLNCFSWLYPI